MAALQGRLEEILSARHKLEEKISRKKSMVENKEGQQRGWNKSDKVYGDYQSEIFRWNHDIRDMETEQSNLDTEADDYERIIDAVTRKDIMGGFDWDLAERIVQMRSGLEQEREGKVRTKKAGEAIVELMEVRKQARAKERGTA
jgi:hypothetical protein